MKVCQRRLHATAVFSNNLTGLKLKGAHIGLYVCRRPIIYTVTKLQVSDELSYVMQVVVVCSELVSVVNLMYVYSSVIPCF